MFDAEEEGVVFPRSQITADVPDLLGLSRSGLREEDDARFLEQFRPPQRFVPPHQAEYFRGLAFILVQREIMESAVKLHEVV
jgi:hypothetical protein